MSPKRALAALAIVTVVYVGALAWMDSRGTFQRIRGDTLPLLGVMLCATVVSVLVRFARWHWLLGRAGHRLPMGVSLRAYLAGFAFTASPGKIGELIRIRYFHAYGVPEPLTFGLFVFERSLDLAVVLALAALAVADGAMLRVVVLFVATVLAAVGCLVVWPIGLPVLVRWFERAGRFRSARFAACVADGLSAVRCWLDWPAVLGAVLLGLVAWGTLAIGFAWLLGQFEMNVPVLLACAIYPLAMLVGAASMIPGGLGSTEATISVLLVQQGITLEGGLLVAVLTRVATLWSAIIVGVACVFVAERRLADMSS